jgi:hypothetical protein
MRKELSSASQEIIFKRNRKKAAELADGDPVLFYADGPIVRLELGSVARCVSCPNVGVVNAHNAGRYSERELLSFAFVHSTRFVGDAIGCYDADGSGDVLCGSCAEKRDGVAS